MPYTWSQFRASVDDFLTVDANRQGALTYIDAMKRQAVIELQAHIPAYRKAHETLYLPDDFVSEGAASRAVLPPQAELQDAYLVKVHTDGTCNRFPLRPYNWGHRFELIHQKQGLGASNGCIVIDPQAYTFYVYPKVTDGWLVSLFWDGLKLDFQDDEETPFDDGMVLAVAEFVKAKLAREVDKDLDMHNSYMTSYASKRRELYITAKDRGRMKK